MMIRTWLVAAAMAAACSACDSESTPAGVADAGGSGGDAGSGTALDGGGSSGGTMDAGDGRVVPSTGNFIVLAFTGPDTGGTLTYELSGATAPSFSTPNGKLTFGKIINDPDAWVKSKENAVATCAQASFFTEITTTGTFTGADFKLTAAIDPEGNVSGRALRSDDQPGTMTVTVFDDSRIEGTFETVLVRTNTTAEPAPTYTVKGSFGGDRKR